MTTMKLPPLYKKNTQGKIELWKVYVVDNYIEVVYGENGSAKFQRKITKITKGKNVGRANATTVREQAEAEAQAKWEKKLKAGYVKTLKDAEAGKTDKIIKGGILPMLAEKYSPKMKLNFPMMIQPKIDDHRCDALKINNRVSLWTRSRKPITSCPHIIEQLEKVLSKYPDNIVLDGGLYVHDMDEKAFEKLMSAVRKKEPSEESKRVEFHIFDGFISESKDKMVSSLPFIERYKFLNELPDYFSHVKFVETTSAMNHKEIELAHKHYTSDGYEGLMIRDPDSVYENKRTKALLKLKAFVDSEFDIVGVEAGKDKTVVFKCKTVNGFVFGVTMHGNKDYNQKYLTKHSLWKGKQLTISYVRLTGKNRTPFHINKVKIRNDL